MPTVDYAFCWNVYVNNYSEQLILILLISMYSVQNYTFHKGDSLERAAVLSTHDSHLINAKFWPLGKSLCQIMSKYKKISCSLFNPSRLFTTSRKQQRNVGKAARFQEKAHEYLSLSLSLVQQLCIHWPWFYFLTFLTWSSKVCKWLSLDEILRSSTCHLSREFEDRGCWISTVRHACENQHVAHSREQCHHHTQHQTVENEVVEGNGESEQ